MVMRTSSSSVSLGFLRTADETVLLVSRERISLASLPPRKAARSRCALSAQRRASLSVTVGVVAICTVGCADKRVTLSRA